MTNTRKVLGLAIISSLISKASGVIYQIISIPLIIKMLGPADFGLFLAYTGFSTWLSLLSLGIAPTIISLAADKRRIDELPNAYFMASFILVSIFIIMGLIFGIAQPILAPHSIIFSPQNSYLFWCAFVIFAVSITLSIGDAINQGQERQHINNINFSCANCINMIVVYFASVYLEGRAVAIVFALSQSGFILSKIFNSSLVLKRVGIKIKILGSQFIKDFIKNSGSFLFMQMSVLISQQAIVILCLEKVGSSISGEMSLIFRSYALLGSVLTMISQPMWPLLKSALTENKHDWIMKVYKKIYLWYLAYGVVALLIIGIFGTSIFNLWTSGIYKISIITCFLIGVHFLLICLVQASTVVLMGLGEFFRLARILMAEAIIGFSYAFFILEGKHFISLSYLILGLIVANLITSFWMLPLQANVILKNLTNEIHK
jgi:O-antigen/teichoic acid export membrane protein